MSELLSSVRFHAFLAPTVLIIGFLSGYLFVPSARVSNVFSLFCLGALGGTLNTYFRLRDLPTSITLSAPDDVLAIQQVYVSPVIAGAFAIVMYIILVGKLIEGPLFPIFQPPSKPNRFIDFLWDSAVADGASAAKLCFWAFAAGFAEKLVPNILDRLAAQALP
jgi:hypothetical protein